MQHSMDNNNNISPVLAIPRLTQWYIRDGFKTLDWYTLYEPDVVLNFHYPDSVLFALLAHIQQPKEILDLGSFFGMMPFITEEIYRTGWRGTGSETFSWTLVDKCLYTKELADVVNGKTTLSSRWLNHSHLQAWHEDVVSAWKKEELYQKAGQYYCPPSNPLEFDTYWDKLAAHYNINRPKMQMVESLEETNNKKFDLVHFDLTAGAYELNKEVFEQLAANNLSDDGIIVFDDMTPRHPKMLLFFQYLITKTEFRPIAFSTGKIALMRRGHKQAFIDKALAAGLIDPDDERSYYYAFLVEGHPDSDWGDFLNLRAN